MIAVVLGLFLLQAAPQGTGFVTGIVRSSNGTPTARVRVYAVTYRDAVEAGKAPPALESLTETDASGRYRLELQPGRYHIATGSVAAPTYFPGTSDVSAARIITVARDLVVPDIDFGTFVPATRTPTTTRPTGNGVLSGVLRYPDGTPASGIAVVAVPQSTAGGSVSFITLPATGTTTAAGLSSVITSTVVTTINNVTQNLTLVINSLFQGNSQFVTDATGAYQFQNLAPDTYKIVAGYAEAPVFYPGVPDAASATGQVVVMNTKIDKLDFAIPRRPAGVTVSGRVSTTSGLPATDATVKIRNRDNPPAATAGFGLPVRNRPQTMIVAADGVFSFPDVQPGTSVIELSYSGVPQQRHEVLVSGQPVSGLHFDIPVTRFSGRIAMEDGSPVPDPKVFGEAILTTTGNPNMLASTLLPISSTGTFSRLMEAGEFRFYFRNLPEEYEIKSMQAGSVDLLKENLKISGKELVDVEVRVARRSTSTNFVSGTIRDSISGTAQSGRITLCCAESGPAEKYSAPLGANGSFAFATLPPGKYTPAVQLPDGTSGLYVVGSWVNVGAQGLQSVALFTAARFGQVSATIQSDAADPVPENVVPSIVFVNPTSGLRVTADRNPAGFYVAMLPRGARYNVSVENLPEGFVVKSDPEPVEPEPGSSPLFLTIGRSEAPRP